MADSKFKKKYFPKGVNDEDQLSAFKFEDVKALLDEAENKKKFKSSVVKKLLEFLGDGTSRKSKKQMKITIQKWGTKEQKEALLMLGPKTSATVTPIVDKLEPKTCEKLVPDLEVKQMKKMLDSITVSLTDVDESPLALAALRDQVWAVSNTVFNVNVIHKTQPKKAFAEKCKKQMIYRNIMEQWGTMLLRNQGKALPGYLNYAEVPAKDFAFEAAATATYHVGQCHGMAFLLGAKIKARFPSATVTVSNIFVPISHVLVLVAMKVNKKKAYYYCDAWTEPPAAIPLSGKKVYTLMKGDLECDSFDVPAPSVFQPLMKEYQSTFHLPWPKDELNPFTWPSNPYHLHPDIIKQVDSVCNNLKFKSRPVPQIEACSPKTIAEHWEAQEGP